MAAVPSELIAAIQALTDKVSTLEAQLNQSREPQAMEDDDEEEEEVFEDPGAINDWDIVLRQGVATPSAAPAVQLAGMFAAPPPLDQLKGTEQKLIRYQGIPQTPAPRRHRTDTALFLAQRKQEIATHQLVHHLESGDRQSLGAAAAYIRSTWEDLQQQRRGLLAGRQSFKLDRRTDDNKARLLSKEEEQKITRGPRPKPRARSFWGEPSQPQETHIPKPTHPKRGRGKGKGKGSS